MQAESYFVEAARAAFASLTVGPAVVGVEERAGVRLGFTDALGYLAADPGGGEVPRWFMADRVSQGITVAQQINSPEADEEVYPLCQWEVVGEERDQGAPRSVRMVYRVVALTDADVWVAPSLVDGAAAGSLRYFPPAELSLEAPEVAAEFVGEVGAYRELPAAEVDALILARVFDERRELLSFRAGPVVAQQGPVAGFWESVRTLSLWSDET